MVNVDRYNYRVKYQKLFDPRCKRASSKGVAAQAEHVTGTHLYAYLQDAAIAPTSRSSSVTAFTAATTEASPHEEIRNVRTALTVHRSTPDDRWTFSLSVPCFSLRRYPFSWRMKIWYTAPASTARRYPEPLAQVMHIRLSAIAPMQWYISSR